MRVEPPVPKPLVISDKDEPAGLMPQDEQWPEPATLLDSRNEIQTDAVSAYTMQQASGTSGSLTARTQTESEEDSGGVYALAFEPDAPRGAGVIRAAEWDQAKAPVVVPSVQPVVRPASTESPAIPVEVSATQPPPFAFKTEIDPLFGDEVKVPVPTVAETKQLPVTIPAPVARMATPADLNPETAVHQTHPTPSPKKKKKKKETAEPEPVASRPSLDTPTSETHVYQLSEAEINRIKPDAPPKTLFFDGVFSFPWQGKNILPWIGLSIGFIIIFLLFALILHVAEKGGMFAGVGAGALGMASLLIVVFNLSYGSACWSNTITYTAAGSNAVDWSTEGWKENVIYFLRMGYYFGLAMMMATPLLVFNFVSAGTYLWLMGTLFVFPIFLFSGMASTTMWNFLNGDVIKRSIVKGHHYLLMYFLSVVIFGISGVAAYFAVQYAWVSILAGPLFAAAWLIYGRLLGRMALALQQEQKKKKKKKKRKPASDSAGQNGSEVEDGSVLETEKGPREDARGPGGARPV